MNLFDLRPQSPRPFDDQANEDQALSGQTYKQTQLLFLLRLAHLLDLRRKKSAEEDETLIKLLDRAIYSTFMDCLEQGVGDEARSLLHQGEKAKKS